jgi:enoyl-CoA hydratase/carnithine racemase
VTGAAPVLVDRTGRVAVVTLNRPEARNGLNVALLDRLEAALRDLDDDPDTGVVVLTGNGPSFCAGADLKEAAAATDFWSAHERTTRSMRIHELLPRMSKPVVAAVDGHAVAGGCGLAMSCDVVVASDRARFGYPEVGRGLVASMAMVSLSRVVGRHHALDLLLSARVIDAAEALRIGMVNRVVDSDRLLPDVMAYAADMAAHPAAALRLTKDLYRHVQEVDYDRALSHARDVTQMVRYTGDARRGVADFGTDRTGGA